LQCSHHKQKSFSQAELLHTLLGKIDAKFFLLSAQYKYLEIQQITIIFFNYPPHDPKLWNVLHILRLDIQFY